MKNGVTLEQAAPGEDLEPILEQLRAVGALLQQISDEVSPGTVRGAEAVIERNRIAAYAAMEALGNAIYEFVRSGPDADRLAAEQQLVLEQIFAFAVGSPTASFVTHDKRHRPSYHELVKHVRAGLPLGADIGARVFDDYFLHSRLGEAYINWLGLVRHRLVEEASHRLSAGDEPLQLVSLQYIGGYDLLPLADVIRERSCQLICLDGQRQAVLDAERTLKPAFGASARFLMAEPLRWLEGPDCPPASVSVIYAESLVQQLSDGQVAVVLQAAYRALRPGGVLLLGSAPGKPPVAEQMIRDCLLGSDWLYRDEAGLRKFFDQAPFHGAAMTFEYEPLGINAMLRVQKNP